MSSEKEKLSSILSKQQEQIQQLNVSIREIEALDIAQLNESLTQRIDELQTELEMARNDLKQQKERYGLLSEENSQIRTALFEQIYQEKVSLLLNSKSKMETYFGKAEEQSSNRLAELEKQMLAMCDEMSKMCLSLDWDERQKFTSEINVTRRRIKERMHQLTQERKQQMSVKREEMSARYGSLNEEPLSADALQRHLAQNSLELKIGSNWVNKAGILLLLLGVLTGGRYAYLAMGPELKSALFFLLGGALLTVGEVMNRKKRSVFSLGLSGGGIAILYASVYVSNILLGILADLPALGVCSGITLAAFLLAIRYNAPVISYFALIGGYVPVYLVGGFHIDQLIYYLVYFSIFNLLTLGLSFTKRWTSLSFGSFLLNLGTTSILVALALIGTYPAVFFPLLLYAVFSFLMYQGVALAHPLRQQQKCCQVN